MTELIIGGRQSGKTTELIKRAALDYSYIVCRSQDEAQRIRKQALEMNIAIPLPMSFDEALQGYGPGVKSVLIDGVDTLLQRLFRNTLIKAVTWDAEYPSNPTPEADDDSN